MKILAPQLEGPLATQSVAGLMSATDKVKLDNVASGSVEATIDAIAYGALITGAFISLIDNSGVLSARTADAASAAVCRGYVLAAYASGATATVYLGGQNTGLSSLTIGETYYLSTGGAVIATAPVTTGGIVQAVGVASATGAIILALGEPIEVL